MPRTRADLVLEALENLGGVGVGQTAGAEELGRIDEKIPSIVSTLAGTRVFYLADLDNIPDAAFAPLAMVVAYECRGKFGVTGDELAALQADNERSIATLRQIRTQSPSYLPARGQYF